MATSEAPRPLIPPPLPEAPPSSTAASSTRTELRSETIATRLSPEDSKAVRAAARRAGKTCGEWVRDLILAEIRDQEEPSSPPPEPVVLAELLGLRAVVVNLIAAASRGPLSPEATAQILAHADAGKRQKAEDVVTRWQAETASKRP